MLSRWDAAVPGHVQGLVGTGTCCPGEGAALDTWTMHTVSQASGTWTSGGGNCGARGICRGGSLSCGAALMHLRVPVHSAVIYLSYL